jgi:hypothetical protein
MYHRRLKLDENSLSFNSREPFAPHTKPDIPLTWSWLILLLDHNCLLLVHLDFTLSESLCCNLQTKVWGIYNRKGVGLRVASTRGSSTKGLYWV